MKKNSIESLNREQLLELLKIYAKNWLAHDGCWFLAIEKKLGIEKAIEFDRDAWEQFTQIEARRIKEFLGLEENSGLWGLKKALDFRLYSNINKQHSNFAEPNALILYIKTCRVQEARRRKGLPDFPCKSIGLVEYSLFAKVIDNRIETSSISCPPERTNCDFYCIWKFSIKE
ncbi:MAG: DUF6125 family protein [Ignavibacteria bacterium]|nr:DUF6125 family protein [Ignavibacteria bacterium]